MTTDSGAGEALFRRSVRIARPAEAVFAWHEAPGAFERLAPPWQRVEVLERRGGIRPGGVVRLRSLIGPIGVEWHVEHRDYEPGRQFRDVALKSPFAAWDHLHRVEPEGADACVLTDEIRYRVPGGAAGRAVAGRWIRGELDRLFAYRHAVTRADLETAAGAAPRCVLLSGASGLIGRALVAFLGAQGWEVRRLVRGAARAPGDVSWDPAAGRISPGALDGVAAVIHLAGENVAGGRWTAARREAIRCSRVDTTRTLVAAMAAATARPEVFVSASAVGYYGDRGDEELRERTGPGRGFLADVCVAWEAEAEKAAGLGVRTVTLRTGVVLTPAGGALAKLLPLFRLGLGGPVGGGRAWMSWISLDDQLGAIRHAVVTPGMTGPVNAVAPGVATGAEFARTLGAVLGRPAVLPAPAWGLRLAFGEMARETVLASQRALPAALLDTGYTFRHPTLAAALGHVLGRPNHSPRP